ncbi:MAG: hypothetical protein ACKO0Z_14735 [Betaproteobacteria bacterium]
MATPASILEAVKRQFPILLHGVGEGFENVLPELTIDAIREYQDRAGFSGELVITADQQAEGGIPLPVDWLEKTGADDVGSTFVSTEIYDKVIPALVAGESDAPLAYIKAVPDRYQRAPFKVTYWRDVAATLEADPQAFEAVVIPSNAVTLIKKYLYLLIAIPNSERLIAAYRGADHPAAENVVTVDVLMERKATLELEMDEQQDFLPPMMIM